MFEAIIVICALGVADQCLTFEDTRGPYTTKTRCEKRINEMARIAPDLYEMRYPDFNGIGEVTGYCSPVEDENGPIITL